MKDIEDTLAFRVYKAALAHDWPEEEAKWVPCLFDSESAVQAAAKMNVPKNLRAVLLLGKRRAERGIGDAATLEAFKHAADIATLCKAANGIRDPMSFVEDGRLLPLAEVRKQLVSALAAADVHIDTAIRQEDHSSSFAVSRAYLVHIYGEEAVKRMEDKQ